MTDTGLAARLAEQGIAVETRDSTVIALPATEEQCAAVLAHATERHLPVLPFGFGNTLPWTRPDANEFQLQLSMSAMADVVAYEPGDGTLTARAGCAMATLEETVHAGGHALTPDVARPAQASLGGVLAGGRSGADRLRYGPLRHHVLGMRVMLADGTIAKSGGRLVKNVTGFDMGRLYTGSRGTLCVILEATLRLFPLQEEQLAITLPSGAAHAAIQNAARVLGPEGLGGRGLPPLAVTIENELESAEYRAHVFLSGRSDVLPEHATRLTAMLPDASVLTDDAAAAHRKAVRDCAPDPHFRLHALPSQIGGALETTRAFARALGCETRAVIQPGVGTLDVRFEGGTFGADATGADELLTHARDLAERLAPGEVRLEPQVLPASVHVRLAPTVAPGARDWMSRIRERFDPTGLFASAAFPRPANPEQGRTS